MELPCLSEAQIQPYPLSPLSWEARGRNRRSRVWPKSPRQRGYGLDGINNGRRDAILVDMALVYMEVAREGEIH